MDWAWQKGVSQKVDMETARLAGQTLAWVLSSTIRKLRDQVTKALVNLLEEQPDALIHILQAFTGIDDAYIAERLYAVAYGCALRTGNREALHKIASYVYDNVFKGGHPPVHVLLRDYARGTIEYALYKGLLPEIKTELIRPPYRSSMPDWMPAEEDVAIYSSNFKDDDLEATMRRKRLHGRIYYSIITGDFGTKVVDGIVSDFSATSFVTENEYKAFKKSLRGDSKYMVSIADSICKIQANMLRRKANGLQTFIDKPIDLCIAEEEVHLQEMLTLLQGRLDDEPWRLFEQKFVPHLRSKYKEDNQLHGYATSTPVKRWIVKRAFELGYDVNKHGEYDGSVDHYNNRHDNEIERIGKKYQWIAFHEITAMLADNFHFKGRLGLERKADIYQGPWQHFLRDVDPAFTTINPEEDDEDDSQFIRKPIETGWWFDTTYNYWYQSLPEWVSNTKDLPAPEHILLKRDESGAEWIYLKLDCHWEQPKLVGQDRFDRPRREIWYLFNSYLVLKKDKLKLIKWLQKKNFFGRWLPESNSSNLSLFNRENYWSPAARFSRDKKSIWEKIEGTNQKVIVTTAEAVGEMSSDKSSAHHNYFMPSKVIFEGMNLQYAPEDGSFKNQTGETIVLNIDNRGVLIKKDAFFSFLEENDYDMVWTLLGEKNHVYTEIQLPDSYFKVINGVYYFEESRLKGKMIITERE